MLKNLKVGTRIAGGFVCVLLLLLAMAGVAVDRMRLLNEYVEGLGKRDLAMLNTVGQMQQANLQQTVLIRDMAVNDDLAVQREIVKNFRRVEKDYADSSASLERLMAQADERTRKHGETILAASRKVAPLVTQALALLDDSKYEDLKPFVYEQLRPEQEKLIAALADLFAFKAIEGERTAAEARQSYVFYSLAILAASAVALLIGVLVAWWVTRGITHPLTEAVRVTRTVAQGNLGSVIDVRSRDETGQLMQALKDMNQSLSRLVSRVREGTQSISTASGEIAAGNLDLSQRTEEQAASLEETAASMDQLTATAKRNADNARQANQLAQSACDVAQKGGSVVDQVVDTMTSIHASSRKIVEIIGVIDGIAFQTNILALNAAVEAARAGDQGRGFAVVASEVRNLAQRSAAAAKEIKVLIDDSVGQVDAGSALVGQAGATMREIVGSVKRVSDIMGEITTVSQEQTAGIEQVNRAITQMDQVTQQNAALVEEASAAAQSMRQQSESLVEVVSTFKLDGDAQAAEVISRVRASSQAQGPRFAAPPAAPARARLAVSTSE